jgi:hypothetical protein
LRTRTELFARLPDAPVVAAEGLNEQLELAGAVVTFVGVAVAEEVVGLGRKVPDAVTDGRTAGAVVVTWSAGAEVVVLDVGGGAVVVGFEVGPDVVAVAAGLVGVAVGEAVLLFDGPRLEAEQGCTWAPSLVRFRLWRMD